MFISTKNIAEQLLNQYSYYNVMDESGEDIKRLIADAVHFFKQGNYSKSVRSMMDARDLILNDLSWRKYEFNDLSEEEELMLKERC